LQWCSGAVVPSCQPPLFVGLIGASGGPLSDGLARAGYTWGGEDPLAITVFQRWVH
jgi:hypothetical protein